MRIAMAMLGILFLMAGCKTYETTTVTIYKPDGTVDKVITKSVEASPFYCKSVSASADVYGIQASFIDPESGSWSPNVKILVGDTDASTLPVTSGREGIVETFGTFRESLTYEKSLWGAELARFGYERTAGGAGVNAKPSVNATIDLNRNAETSTNKTSSEVK